MMKEISRTTGRGRSLPASTVFTVDAPPCGRTMRRGRGCPT
uniref:Uncharacterized protein n=1 Tax=Arundo donax TaxID=35708 RepID=A0A0A9BJ94_ARUDO